jgi:hypothetical protein
LNHDFERASKIFKEANNAHLAASDFQLLAHQWEAFEHQHGTLESYDGAMKLIAIRNKQILVEMERSAMEAAAVSDLSRLNGPSYAYSHNESPRFSFQHLQAASASGDAAHTSSGDAMDVIEHDNQRAQETPNERKRKAPPPREGGSERPPFKKPRTKAGKNLMAFFQFFF